MISVIIPTYQSAQTIISCLESVFLQSITGLEVIVVDDGSTDETQDLLATYRDRVITLNTTHRGAAAARNTGARSSSGDFLFFCDSDIILEKNALAALQSALIKHPECSYAYGGFIFDGRLIRPTPFDGGWLRKINYISTMSLIRASDFPGFDESLRRYQDWDLWLTLLDQNKYGCLVNKTLFRTLPRQGISKNSLIKMKYDLIVRYKHHCPIPNFITRLFWKISFTYYQRISVGKS